jgi:hypothetical protein
MTSGVWMDLDEIWLEAWLKAASKTMFVSKILKRFEVWWTYKVRNTPYSLVSENCVEQLSTLF